MIDKSRDDVLTPSSPPGPVGSLSSGADMTPEWGSEDFRPNWGLPNPPPHPDEGLEWSNTIADWARKEAYFDRGKQSVSPPPKLPVETLFTRQYDGQLPFSYLRPADFYSRRSGEHFDPQGVEASSVGERFDPQGVEALSVGERFDLQGVEALSVPSSGVEKGERVFTGDCFSSSSVMADVPRGVNNGEHGHGEHDSESSLQNESSVALPRTAKTRRTLTTKQAPVVEDADFDALLEAQRVEDLAIRAEEPTHIQKRRREVLSDHDFRLRKERTDSLLEGYRSVVRRRSARLRDKQLPEDYDPPPPALGRGEESDDDDPDSLIAGTQNRLEWLTILGNEKKKEPTRVVLTVRQIRRIMAAKESLFKFGIFVPRSDREAQASPEAPRWRAGRDLE